MVVGREMGERTQTNPTLGMIEGKPILSGGSVVLVGVDTQQERI